MDIIQIKFKKEVINQAIGVIKGLNPLSTIQDVVNELQSEVDWLDQCITESEKNGKENNQTKGSS